nr:MAG TPA: GMP-PDE, delta subunit [Caudoviricetes sp.]
MEKTKTAHDAIKATDKPPNAVRETVENMRREANKRGFEVFGRIKLKDMKTGKIYR